MEWVQRVVQFGLFEVVGDRRGQDAVEEEFLVGHLVRGGDFFLLELQAFEEFVAELGLHIFNHALPLHFLLELELEVVKGLIHIKFKFL